MKRVRMRKVRMTGILLTVLSVSIIFHGRVLAQSQEELLKKIEALERRVKQLESKALPEQPPAPVSAPLSLKLPDIFNGISLSGFVDAAYTYNTNKPSGTGNAARVFDTEVNSFAFQAGKLALEKLPAAGGGVGFRTDLLFGQDAEVITPSGSSRDQFDVEQAYVDIIAPLGRGLDIKAGKFVTLAGAEVIESKDNWNFSRSLLFGYAIPFTHTGVRISYPLTDKVTAYAGINNGWDNVKDNNRGKSMESSLAWSPLSWLFFNLTGIYGPEQSATNKAKRSLVDLVATYKPAQRLTLKLNTDYAREDSAVGDKDASWSGIAGYLRYDLTDKWSLAQRGEYFSDPQGVRVTSGTRQSLWENTSTVEFRPFKDLITRLEYRYDHASSNIFTRGTKADDHQSTIGLEAIYAF